MNQRFAVERHAVLEVEGEFVVLWRIDRPLLLCSPAVFLGGAQVLAL